MGKKAKKTQSVVIAPLIVATICTGLALATVASAETTTYFRRDSPEFRASAIFGKKMFQAYQCAKCHAIREGEALTDDIIAPNLILSKERLRPRRRRRQPNLRRCGRPRAVQTDRCLAGLSDGTRDRAGTGWPAGSGKRRPVIDRHRSGRTPGLAELTDAGVNRGQFGRGCLRGPSWPRSTPVSYTGRYLMRPASAVLAFRCNLDFGARACHLPRPSLGCRNTG